MKYISRSMLANSSCSIIMATCASCDNKISEDEDFCIQCIEKKELNETLESQSNQIEELTTLVHKLYLFINKNFKDGPTWRECGEYVPRYLQDEYEKELNNS